MSLKAKDEAPQPGDKRAQLLAAAIEVFSERGYRATSMWDLARAVDLSKPALYHYVPSKEALLVELYESVTTQGVESAQRVIAKKPPPVQALRELLIERIVYTCENRRLLQIFFEEEAEIPESLMRSMRRQRRAYEDALIQLLNRGTDEGVFEFTSAPRIVVNTLLGAAHWTYKWFDPHGIHTAQEIAEEITDLLLAGVVARPRSSDTSGS
jgi:AcrR family transcriptional regulator